MINPMCSIHTEIELDMNSKATTWITEERSTVPRCRIRAETNPDRMVATEAPSVYAIKKIPAPNQEGVERGELSQIRERRK